MGEALILACCVRWGIASIEAHWKARLPLMWWEKSRRIVDMKEEIKGLIVAFSLLGST